MKRLEVNWRHFAGSWLSILVIGLLVQFGWRFIYDTNPPLWTATPVGLLVALIYPRNPFYFREAGK